MVLRKAALGGTGVVALLGAGAQADPYSRSPTVPAAAASRSRASIPMTRTQSRPARPVLVQEPERVVTQPQDLRGGGDPNSLGVELGCVGPVQSVLAQARGCVRHRAQHGDVPRLLETALDQAYHLPQNRVLPHLPLDHIGRISGRARAEKLPSGFNIPDGQGTGVVEVQGGIIPRAFQ
eukprot:scaffold131155_cov31-Tisochrysis_lutea.AAC.1